MQKYFAGELRPDQLESWRADDGIFYLVSEVEANISDLIAAKNGRIAGLEAALVEKIAALRHSLKIQRNEWERLNKHIDKQDEQIATLTTELDAWKEVLGTSQLSHAQARLEEAEKQIATLTEEIRLLRRALGNCNPGHDLFIA